ncbi:MAG: MobA/MobL family protein [Fusobacteriaceae bacterium]
MALYMLHVYTRKTGATKKMSYNFRENEYKNRKNENLLLKESYNLPDWAENNSKIFWEAVDNYETRSNATKIRCVDFSLPREFSTEENIAIARKYSNEILGKDYVYSVAIHEKLNSDGTKNTHAHVMFSERKLDGIERSPEVFFKQANKNNPEKGGARKERSWWEKKTLYDIRERWENTLNNELEKKGIEKVSCKSLQRLKAIELEKGNVEKAEFYDREPINISKKILKFKDKTKLDEYSSKKYKEYEINTNIKNLKREKLLFLENNNLINKKEIIKNDFLDKSILEKNFKNSSLHEKIELAIELEVKIRFNKFSEKTYLTKIETFSTKEDQKSLFICAKYKEKLKEVQKNLIELNSYKIKNINSKFFNVHKHSEDLNLIKINSLENKNILENKLLPINDKILKMEEAGNNIKNPEFIKLRKEQDQLNSKIRNVKVKIFIINSNLNGKIKTNERLSQNKKEMKNVNTKTTKNIAKKGFSKNINNSKVASKGFVYKRKRDEKENSR